jgi:LytS/YehU family sensor histidine kinase
MQLNWLFLFVVIFLLASLNYLLFRYMLKQKMASYAKQVMLSDLRAIRAQMNPHFIFNSLNSINRYILTNKPFIASDYLGRFAKLMRLVLDNSNHERISLNQELESMQLYVELEQLRFEHSFDYRTEIDPDIDLEKTLVQPLIFQPFIENAIWHGLMHTERKDKVLQLNVLEKNGRLICEILDNGAGRKPIKTDTKPRKKSYGINLGRDRLKFLDPLATVEIVDLKDDQEKSIGTKAILNFKKVEEYTL